MKDKEISEFLELLKGRFFLIVFHDHEIPWDRLDVRIDDDNVPFHELGLHAVALYPKGKDFLALHVRFRPFVSIGGILFRKVFESYNEKTNSWRTVAMNETVYDFMKEKAKVRSMSGYVFLLKILLSSLGT